MAASSRSVSLEAPSARVARLGVLQPVFEQRRAAFDRGGRVVQLVSQPG
jgi:hypothetical protein